MECEEREACFKEIEAYCNKPADGLTLLVHTENDHDLQLILSRLKADRNKTCLYLSETCLNRLAPQLSKVEKYITPKRCLVLVGVSSYGMLMGKETLYDWLRQWLNTSPKGHVIVLLSHVKNALLQCMGQDPRLPRRVIFLSGEPSSLPRIRLYPESYVDTKGQLLNNLQGLLHGLEIYDSASPMKELQVRTPAGKENFSSSMFSITSYEGPFMDFCKKYPGVGEQLSKDWGSEEAWKQFVTDWEEAPSWEKLGEKYFGVAQYYSIHLSSVWMGYDSYRKWLLWLLMKVKGTPENPYLQLALDESQQYTDLLGHIYLTITGISRDSTDFEGFFDARLKLLDGMQENAAHVKQYQDAMAQMGAEALYYLSDRSDWERIQFFYCLANYPYEKKDIQKVLKLHFPEIYAYMEPFTFQPRMLSGDPTASAVDAAQEKLGTLLTKYFDEYKWQKLQNKVSPAFNTWVEDLAKERLYNRLPERSLLMNRFERKREVVFFVDALGVEYLSYIQEKCKQYGLRFWVRVCHGQLPTITAENKEFVRSDTKPFKKLDELKHHSPTYNYEKQKLPIHLVAELQVIDELLMDIRAKLLTKEIQQAVLVSDHGATRLAVLQEVETGGTLIEGENKGQHGGRCCRAACDPHIPYVAYENSYAVLANYSRFKGSRKADVEVHGGATLEETLVPLIQISLAPTDPADMKVGFIRNTIVYKKNEPLQLIVTTNFDIEEPRLIVHDKDKEKEYIGKLDPMKRRATFTLSDIKRAKDYVADVYDGEILLKDGLEFHVQRAMAVENDLF